MRRDTEGDPSTTPRFRQVTTVDRLWGCHHTSHLSCRLMSVIQCVWRIPHSASAKLS